MNDFISVVDCQKSSQIAGINGIGTTGYPLEGLYIGGLVGFTACQPFMTHFVFYGCGEELKVDECGFVIVIFNINLKNYENVAL